MHQWVNCCFRKAVEENITVGYFSTAWCGVCSLSCVYCFKWLCLSSDCFGGPVLPWSIKEFKSTPNQEFPILPNKTINDVSTDQYYAYRICWAVILGEIDSELRLPGYSFSMAHS